MFKIGLLATTAFVVVGSLSFAAAYARLPVRPLSGKVATHDRNHEFLCTYGQLSISAFQRSISSSNYSTWTHVAVPVVGHGKTIHQITVKEAQSRYTSGSGLRSVFTAIPEPELPGS
jgi:hypothetical protein